MGRNVRGCGSGNRYFHTNYNEQICWECGNATGGCSWSREYKPIEGWDAEEVYKENYYGDLKLYTYNIHSCPEFVEDTKRKKIVMTDDGLREFAYSIFVGACEEWVILYKDCKRLENLVLSGTELDRLRYSKDLIKNKQDMFNIQNAIPKWCADALLRKAKEGAYD